ncbi:hypothetical protein [Phytohabitans houttuyneae]|nr:hypothetical protein [Phytohabitans houttuyneae]
MAIRTWSRVLLAALGVAMLAAASQLGVAFGLGVVRLSRTFPVDQENQWTAQMAWVAWFAMVAAVAGAVAADRMARRHGYEGGIGSRTAYSFCAGIGAAVLVPLCMQPARFAIVRSTDPVLVIGLSAALGAVAGVFVALAALSHRPLLWNVGAITGAAWLLALISVIPSLGPDDPLPNLRLGVLDLASFSTGAAQSSAVVTMPLLALVIGAATAGIGRWLGRPPVTIAASGIIGPATLSLAYLVAGPGTDTDKFQAAPYWGALVAVGAGTLGSVLATVARRPNFGPATPDEEPAPAAPQEQPLTGQPPREQGIEPVFRDPPAGEWSVPLPRHGTEPSPAPPTPALSSASAADETTASLPTVEPPASRGGSFFSAPEPAPARDSGGAGRGRPGGGLFDEPTADLAPPPSPPQAPPPPGRKSRRSASPVTRVPPRPRPRSPPAAAPRSTRRVSCPSTRTLKKPAAGAQPPTRRSTTSRPVAGPAGAPRRRHRPPPRKSPPGSAAACSVAAGPLRSRSPPSPPASSTCPRSAVASPARRRRSSRATRSTWTG